MPSLHTQVDAVELLDFVVVDCHCVNPLNLRQPRLLDQARLDEQLDVQVIKLLPLLLVHPLVFDPGE